MIIQTYNVNDYVIQYARNLDYEGFYNLEISHRKELDYPPHYRLALILVKGNIKENVEGAAEKIFKILKGNKLRNMMIVGVTPAPLSRIKGKYRWQIIIKGKESASIRNCIAKSIAKFRETEGRGGVDIEIDIDPQNMM